MATTSGGRGRHGLFRALGGRARGGFSPAQTMVLGFAGLILVGTCLLALPAASATGESIGLVDAFFTATSAACVTGLQVRDTATTFSPFGQAVILLLVQAGGLGTTILATLVALILGKRISLRERLALSETLGTHGPSGVVRLVREILVLTVLAEAAGALLLFARFALEHPPGRAVWLAVFHAVSAYNNAGFDLFSRSLRGHATDGFVLLVVAGLIILGGIGYIVVLDVRRAGLRWQAYSLHSRIALATTLGLLALGTALFALLEWHNPRTLGALPPAYRLLAAFFTAVTPRTAGFEVVPTGGLAEPSLLLTIALMFIGASPGGTGGGIKTTTFATLLLALRAAIRGEEAVVVAGRHLPDDQVRKAWVIAASAAGWILGLTGVLLVTEAGHRLTEVLFEVVSAFGTVGLTTGLTPQLSPVGRVLIALMMYSGRVGPLTLAVALAERRRPRPSIQFPEERVMIG